MTQTYFPFDSGSGANVTESMWGQMAQFWLGTGVIKGQLNQLNTFADSTGMQVKTDTGMAWIQGYYYKNDALVVLPIATANATNPRIDRVVVRVDWTANTIQLAVLQGTPAASPTAPTLTQNTAKWEISLAQVYVGANVSTIASGNITDERIYAGSSSVHPYFYMKYALWGGIGSANALNQVPISSGNTTSSGVTVSGSDIIVKTTGVYLIMFQSYIQSLTNPQTFDTLFRIVRSGSNIDDDSMIFAPSGVNANSSSPQGIPCSIFGLYSLQAGDTLRFFVRSSEAPHNLTQTWVSGVMVSN